MPEVAAQFQAPGHRYTDDELQNLSNQPVQPPRRQEARSARGGERAQFQ